MFRAPPVLDFSAHISAIGPPLEELRIITTCSDSTVIAIAEHCPQLRVLQINANCPKETMAKLLK